jgi:glycosyltransferase involved in cell wall biosynthesis
MLALLPSAELYGSDRAAAWVVEDLVNRVDVHVVAAADGPLVQRLRDAGASVQVGADWALRRRYLKPSGLFAMARRAAVTLRMIRRLNRERPFDIVYANTVASTLLPFLRAALPGARIVVHAREIPRTSPRFSRVHFGAIARNADLVIANSSATRSAILAAAPRLRGRTATIPDGVPTPPEITVGESPGSDLTSSPALPFEAQQDSEPQQSSHPAHAGLRIVCVGRLHPNKGQQHLIDAVGLGVRAGHDWRLDLWGDALPEYHDNVRALRTLIAEHGLTDRVRFRGFGSECSSMYGGNDVAVVPSQWPEGFSLVTVEAQLAGLPVVATKPGGPEDIIVDGETGILVPQSDPVALFEAIRSLEDTELRRKLGAAGRERAASLFTVAQYVPAVSAALLQGHP